MIRKEKPMVSRFICEFIFEHNPAAPPIETLENYESMQSKITIADQQEIFNMLGAVSYMKG
jgi:hypothetical protein